MRRRRPLRKTPQASSHPRSNSGNKAVPAGSHRQHGRDYRSVMPTNLYGPHDNYHPENSHVIPALLRRFHAAVRNGDEELVVWGTGKPMREFLHVGGVGNHRAGNVRRNGGGGLEGGTAACISEGERA